MNRNLNNKNVKQIGHHIANFAGMVSLKYNSLAVSLISFFLFLYQSDCF